MPTYLDIVINPNNNDRKLDEFFITGLTHKEIFLDIIPGAVDSYIEFQQPGYPHIPKDDLLEALEYWLLQAEEIDDLFDKQDKPESAAEVPKDKSTAPGEAGER